MPIVELEDMEWQGVLHILGTTKDHPWVVTNPLLTKIGNQLRTQALAQQQAIQIKQEDSGHEHKRNN